MAYKGEEAVIAVDVQADFTEYRNGSLAAPNTGLDYVEKVVARTREYKAKGLPIIATMDDHPPDHVSFVTTHPGAKPGDVVQVGDVEQVVWPPHCIHGTPGAEILIPDDLITAVIRTATRSRYDSYSAFRDDGGQETGLQKKLEELGVTKVIVYGLVTDVCVKATVIHALDAGFEVRFVRDLSRAISDEGESDAIAQMREKGAEIEE